METTSTSKTYTIPDGSTLGSIGDIPNYSQYCFYRLPCGICTRTNEFCPLNCNGKGTAMPSWFPGTVVYTTGSGTIPADQIAKGETTAHLMC